MMMQGIDFETVQVENCQFWIPSNICTDRDIFQQVFSMETWNKVFTPEQRDSIMKMLPAEAQSSPAEAAATIEDLLNGSLTRFNSNPLDAFFNELNMGGYDPQVSQIKTKIKRQWRRDLLRKRRNYQTKLLQEVIISSQSCLRRLSDKKLSKIDSQNYLNSKSNNKPTKIESSKPMTAKKKSAPSKPSALRQKVAKRLHNEIQAMNQAFPSSVSSSDGTTAPKKPKPLPKSKVAPMKVAILNEGAGNVKSVTVTSSSDTASLNMINTQLSNASRATHSDSLQPSIQMAKFPNVIPPSLLGVINVTQSPGLSHPKPQVSLNHFDVKTVQKEFTQPKPMISQQVIHKHSIKSSPILASQLQAPISSGNKSTSVGAPSLNKIGLSSDLHPTAMKIEEESSSEDEFEAIEPTIGFSPMLPSISKTQMPQPQLSMNPKSQGAVVRHQHCGISGSRNIQTKKTMTTVNSPLPRMIHTTASTPNIPKSYIQPPSANPNLKVTSSKAVIANTPHLLQNPSIKIAASKGNSVKLVSGASSSPFISTTQAASVSGPTTTATKLSPHIVQTQCSAVPTKLIPISLSNLPPNPNNTQSFRGSVFQGRASTTSTAMLNGGAVSSQGMITSTTTIGSSNFSISPSPLQAGRTVVSQPGNLLGSLSHSSVLGSFGSVRAPAISPIPLTLSDLSLSLNLGLDVTGDKLDKIDDLSVLDGNAFDSIPNLSDDLDVFDLDLVDGLCDFEVMLSEEKQYTSFFALIREVLCSTQNHRMTLSCLEKTVQKWATGPSSELNAWFHRISGWNEALITGLNFLVGNYPEIHPEDFVPYIEYKNKTKYYQWIGAGRDSDANLSILCNIWLENLEKLPPVKKQDGDNDDHEDEEDENEDSDEHTEEVKKKYLRPKTPPPPRFVTEWTVRPSTLEEKEDFQAQEKVRFDNPHKSFTYRMHKYESVVGPVKGVYSNQTGVTNKARGHSLLVDDRPPYVTILALVRDSVARLPNGEGTRSEICEMLRDSAFLAPEASNVTLNSVVSGALDRLHYERDPCVRYDSHKKNWIYLHRDRSQEQFERLHHNRSYTKSTKSRNSNGRKSRKKISSQSSVTNPSNETSSTMQSSTASVSSAPATTPKALAPPVLTPISSVVSMDLSSVSQASAVQIVSSDTTTVNRTAVGSLVKSASAGNVFVSAASDASPTIQFAIPVSSSQLLLNRNWNSTHSDPAIPSTVVTQFQNFASGNQITSNTSANQAAIPLCQSGPTLTNTLPMQQGKIVDVKVENPTSLPTTSSASNVGTQSLQQQSYILNNLFRLPNLKFPDNVRLMKIQQNPAGQVQVNPLRLPQQRIVLRPAFPGHVPGQGVILGQTPTGQTVIISAIGGPQILTSNAQAVCSTASGTTGDTKVLPLFSSSMLPTSSVLTMLRSSPKAGNGPVSTTATPGSPHSSNIRLKQNIPSTLSPTPTTVVRLMTETNQPVSSQSPLAVVVNSNSMSPPLALPMQRMPLLGMAAQFRLKQPSPSTAMSPVTSNKGIPRLVTPGSVTVAFTHQPSPSVTTHAHQ